MLEANLIKKYKPVYNTRFLDDKSFPYIKIGKIPYPYVSITRRHDEKNAGYFGPYVSVTDVKTVLRILRKIFPYHSVKNHPKRKCLYYHLGLCPCIPARPENLPGYKKNIRNLLIFLSGKINLVIKFLKQEQKGYIQSEQFEKARDVQEIIEKIEYITSDRFEPFLYENKPDFYFERIKTEVESLRSILESYGVKINKLEKIECYDISNILGKEATGSMVVFLDGHDSRKDYRRFKIRFNRGKPDDPAMLGEVLTRRIKHAEWEKPDLIVVDGGKGQVSSVLKAISSKNYQVPVVGLAKREETIVVPIKAVGIIDFLEVKLPKSTPGINLLRRIRDEAHRFALNYHRQVRKKRMLG